MASIIAHRDIPESQWITYDPGSRGTGNPAEARREKLGELR